MKFPGYFAVNKFSLLTPQMIKVKCNPQADRCAHVIQFCTDFHPYSSGDYNRKLRIFIFFSLHFRILINLMPK